MTLWAIIREVCGPDRQNRRRVEWLGERLCSSWRRRWRVSPRFPCGSFSAMSLLKQRRETAYVEVYRTTDFIAEGIEGDLVLSQVDRIFVSKEEVRFLPDSAVGSEDDLARALQGRVAAGPISANSIIAADQWVAVTIDIKPLAEQIPSGNRR